VLDDRSIGFDDRAAVAEVPPVTIDGIGRAACYAGGGVEGQGLAFVAHLLHVAIGHHRAGGGLHVEDLDLERDNIVWDRVRRIAKRNDRPIVGVSVRIKVEDPREALREFERSSIDDVGCMEATLKRLESDTGAMVERANAWAVGDLRTLEDLRVESEIRACALALLGTDALKNRGFNDLPKRVVDEWVRVAEESLAEHATTVAVADYQVLTADDGLLAAMRGKGYTIIAPGEEPPADAVAEDQPAEASAPVEAVEPASN
jgi:hypothetical protein